MSAQSSQYKNYVTKNTKSNVEPEVGEQGVMPKSLDGETWTDRSLGRDAMTHRWGDREYGPVRVEVSNLGRVREIQSIRRGWSFIVAVHATKQNYFNYQRPLGMFHYLNT